KEYLVLRVNDKKFLFGTLPNDSNINQGSFDSISSDGKNVTYTYEWNDDTIPQGDRDLVVTPIVESISNDLKVKSIKSAKGTIKDDDRKQNEPDPEYYDPIVIDLNKDGTTTSKLNGAVNFDIDSNGFKEATGWISPEDAFLAYDRDDNGIIDNGNELFGDKTIADTTRGYTDKTAKNGFEALRAFDTNNDNIIDKNDEKFNKLLLWQDKNSNALTDDGELFALQDKNIKSIDLNYQEVSIDNNGNFIKQTSTVTFNDNTTTTADDVWFKVDLKDTEQSDADISSSITALPEIYAFGNIYNLRNAMSMDSSLVDMVNGYVVLDQDSKEKQIDNLIFKWAGVEGIDINSRGSYIDARVLGVYEKMTGKPFYHKSFGSNPNSSVANMLNDLYKEFKDYAYATIELQTTYKGLIDTKYQYYNYDANKYGYDFSNLNSKIRELYNSQNHEEIAKINGLIKKAAIYRDNLLASFEENLINLTSGNEQFKYVAMSNYIKGTDKGETINGSNAKDWIEGKKGDDYLSGGSGDDVYVYRKGDGSDTIYDPQGANKLKFRDINRDEVDFLRENDYLSIQIKDTNEKITVQNFFNHYTQPAISIFEFADGATVLANEIRAFNLIGDDNDNSIYGFISDDVLKGNKGDDKLYGGQGNDAYVFNRGDGKDTIDDESGQDTIKFEGDITPEDILLTREQDRLIINILDKDKRPTGDSILVTDFFSFSSELGDGNIEKIVFSNGQIWDKNKILEKAKLEATENRDTFYLTSNDDVFDALGGDDEIRGGVGNDTIAGNQGNDTLYGDDGNDTLIGGKGNDKLYGGSGNDTYVYYKGDGNDVIEDTYGNNIIDFKNIKFDEIEFLKSNSNLIIKIKENGETITINDILSSRYMNGDNLTFKFMDERVISIQDIEFFLIGDDQNNYLNGYPTSDTIYGKKGNDTIYGGSGNDTYIYYKGDGNDTISDHSGSDTLDFKDITKSEVRFLKKDDSLLIDIKDTNEKIKIESFFHDSNSLKTFKFLDGTSMTSDEIKAVFLIGDEYDNAIYGYASNDKLYGKEGNDKLYGGAGNDIIDGGVGNDILIGNEGSDTYLFGIGDGKDVVYALDTSSNIFSITQNGDYVINNYYNINFSQGKDIIKFKEGITKNDLTFERAGTNQHDLLIKIKESEDSITVKAMFKDVSGRIYSIDKIEFSDGSSMSFEEIYKATPITFLGESVIGSSYSDTIYANNDNNIIRTGYGDDLVYAKAGNDTVYGEGGDDTIDGGAGNDTVYGEGGDDTIDGGAGNDTLYGGDGSDTYVFGKGDGQDTIHADGKDTLKFKEGITKDNLVFQRVKSNQYEYNPIDLLIRIKNSEDSIIVKEMFKESNNSKGLKNIEFGDGSSMSLEDIKKATLLGDGSSADSIIYGFETDDIIRGGSSKDIVFAREGNDTIYGKEGSDILYGEKGNDIIEGGAGNDTLYGGEGNDIYIFGRGDGEDIIHDEANSYDEEVILNRNDVIKFKEGISINDLKFQRVGENKKDLLIKIKNSEDSITVKNMFEYENNRSGINKILFNDGSSMDYKDIVKASPVAPNLSNDSIYGSSYSDTIYGDDRDNTIYGKDGDDLIYGKAGNDKIYGGEGNDILEGETGDDDLYGGDGDDILEGGVGNDTLRGKEGSDTYIFGKGDGQDIIYADGKDTIKFKESVSEDDLVIARAKSNTKSLLIRIKDSTDSILVDDMFINENNTKGIKGIEFNDGSMISYEEIRKKVLISSDPDQTRFEGFSSNDIIVGSNKDDYIYGKDGDDRLVGNKGNDTVYGGDGNDTIDAGEGDDKIDGGKGGDVYLFGRGDGQDAIENYDDSLNRMDDTIRFKEGITRDDLIFQRVRKHDDSSDFVIKIKGTEDSISVRHMFDVINNNHILNEKFKISKIEFSDGSSMNIEDIQEAIKNNNVVILDNPYWHPQEGSDENDEIYGDDDRNTLKGNKGDDILIGGKGHDELYGGEGNDTYLFGRGDGEDTIYNDDSTPNRRDIIKFKEGITADDLVFKRTNGSGRDLKIEIKGADDSITVNDMFDSENTTKHIDGVELSDGSFISLEDIKQKVLISPDSNNNTLFGFSTDDTLLGGDGNDYLNGKGGNDILKGGLGDDEYGYDYNSGYDIIEDMGGDDKLYIDILMRDLEFKKDNEDLLISVYKSPNQSIRVKNHFLADKYSIDKISFNIYDEDSFLGKDEITKLANSIYLSSENGNKTLNGGKEDHIYTYTGGKVSISDLGGDDKVVFRLDNPGDGLFYLSNGRDLKISTNRIDDSNNDVLEIKNFFINKNAVIENFDINDHWNVTAQSIFEKYNKPFPPELPDTPTPPPPSNPDNGSSGDTLTGGSEDNIFNYNGGIVSITDAGGNDKVIFTNPGSRVFYQSNGVDLKISTAKIDSSNNDILEVKNFFVNKSSIVETFQLNDYWSVTAQSIYQAFGLTYPIDNTNTNPNPPSDNNNLTGGSEDNVFTYTGGKKSITDMGGNDKVIFANPGSSVYYQSNGRDLKISTAKINSSNNDVLEVKNFFIDANAIIETFQLSDYWTVTAQSIYQAF
ncbi:calcium-binding protein, partial [Campylobacter sp. RM16189]|uniref:calcium-binding protein n=1 Tax=Campylobacter sp. RM16189 TaxID=1705726 RepID=UPI001473917E